METAVVIRGKLTNRAFVSDDPMPALEGPAELIVYAPSPAPTEADDALLFDLFGKAPQLRSGEDIDAQLREEVDFPSARALQ
jgi:hypothetical protein